MSANETATQIPVRRASLAHEVDVTGEVVVFDEHGNRLLLLNQVGAAVWLLIDGARSESDIAAVIVATLSLDAAQAVQAEQVEQDVRVFVASLLQHGVIELR